MRINAALDYLFVMSSKDESISPHELFEMRLLKDIIPSIQMHDTEKYISFLSQLCSIQKRSLLEEKLVGKRKYPVSVTATYHYKKKK
ncbi:MAG: hypothetical protein LBC27_01995 [Spirochaetaceae bacterium]|jgi:hypothetical protein|nr:hypothetical protein [Spirochaetaceae bacterium]